ncbi:MAG: hypothetical protein ACPG5B_08905 [Chitinophagales bacterium]
MSKKANRKKSKRIQLESKIITKIFSDNRNTVHFDYHVNIDDEHNSISLDLYTKNALNDEIFLLHKTNGTSSIDVLEKMMQYLEQSRQNVDKNSYTVSWRNKNEKNDRLHTSYFYEYTEADVRQKFFYNKNEEDFEISIKQNPIT